MAKHRIHIDEMLMALQERTKELNCIYRIEELLQDDVSERKSVLGKVIEAIPLGWQYPEFLQARIVYQEEKCSTPGFKKSSWVQSANIRVHSDVAGVLEVSYTKEMPEEDEGPFLEEERKLINTLADRIGHYIMHRQLKLMFEDMRSIEDRLEDDSVKDSKVITELLLRTDRDLFTRLSRKMANYLYRMGIPEVESILGLISSDRPVESSPNSVGYNVPTRKKLRADTLESSKRIFEMASKVLHDKDLTLLMQRWMQEDKASFLFKSLNDPSSDLSDISDNLRRFRQLSYKENIELSESLLKSIRVHLIRKLMSDRIEFIKIAKEFIDLDVFFDLLPRIIFHKRSHGRLGGKGSGLFLASQVVNRASLTNKDLFDIRVPKTYYLATDGLHNFLAYNDLEDVFEQKYKDIEIIRQEYPQIIEIFKNSNFPLDIVQQLSLALDDFGDSPLIVRSSSLLEDQLGATFSGKYKSLFLGNQGEKQDRLEALMDAIAEVYASTFSPDPIEYRKERDLIDSQEEMGVLIQEVVGTKIGRYFLPAYAGVAYSSNEFRWSPRIKREDGLIRLVPGLGTRAVDRLSDDYPILIAAGQPNLRVNITQDEIVRYSQHKIDLINLESNSFETIDIAEFMQECGEDFKHASQLVSVVKDGMVQPLSIMVTDFDDSDIVVTFEDLIRNTSFVKQTREILSLLQDKLGTPVDIEFASDGEHFYLLQCRPQGYGKGSKPAPIPKDIPESALVFSANRYISNGHVPDITHIVYVDPHKYSEIGDKQELINVGRAVSKLNINLPKRQFILMGPGRWGSRGDIKLGVSVTYSDISNTAVLIEIARKKENYVPDLSFGTHFFQDLVESEIRYLPLYPDDEGIIFHEKFLTSSHNVLGDILPEYEYLSEVVRVIDVPKTTDGKILQIYMNADIDEAMAVLTQPSDKIGVMSE